MSLVAQSKKQTLTHARVRLARGKRQSKETMDGIRFVLKVRETAPRTEVTGYSSTEFKDKILGRK